MSTAPVKGPLVRAGFALALLLFIAACSAPDDEPAARATGTEVSEREDTVDGDENGDAEGGKDANKAKGGKRGPSGGKPGAGGPTPGATPGTGTGEDVFDDDGEADPAGDEDDGDDEAGDDGDSPNERAVRFPAGGSFSYSQSGYEEFCGGPSCDRQPLPPTQRVTNRVTKRSASSVTVVSEARASDKRLMRTTTRFGRQRADIVYLVSKFEYGNFRFSESYAPQPPILAMTFPFAPGQGWDGTWQGESSGRYSVQVERKERVRAAGRTIDTFKVIMNVNVESDYDARLDLALWIDPETNLPVKTSGSINASNAFGSYESVFSTTLASGPGY